MLIRTNPSIVHFFGAFSLTGVDRVLPPGDYAILEEEELIEGLSWIAYKRVNTFIEIPSTSSNTHMTQLFTIDHDDLQTKLQKDTALVKSALIGKLTPDRNLH